MKKLFVAVMFAAVTAGAFPKPTGYVNDYANVLRDKSMIEHRISEYHKQTTNEIAVVTIDSLGGEPIEDYAHRLFKEWGIGAKGNNNGVLILVVVRDHKTRIEVGYGLEGRLNDAFCGRVIRDDMIPAFKQGDFSLGIQHALTTLMARMGNTKE